MAGAHPGFKNVAAGMAKKQGISANEAGAELAASTRKASPAAKKANPNLKNVRPAGDTVSHRGKTFNFRNQKKKSAPAQDDEEAEGEAQPTKMAPGTGKGWGF